MIKPLKFLPIYKDKIWGGNKIRTVLGKDFGSLPNCGESWEVSGVPGNVSIVREGPHEGKLLTDLISNYGPTLLGKRVYDQYQAEFPLLIKFIDANDDLSVQVHPGDPLAMERHHSFGKTEMWYVLQADEEASLIAGFNRKMDKNLYLEYFKSGRLMEILNKEHVRQGDVFYIPAGRIHTIGKGLLLAEIQQSSDITYRIYDFNRMDEKGQKRELHTELALDAIDYNFYEQYHTTYDREKTGEAVQLVRSEYFTTHRMVLNEKTTRQYSHLDTFVVLICPDGAGKIMSGEYQTSISRGDTVLIPADSGTLELQPVSKLTILETYITRN